MWIWNEDLINDTYNRVYKGLDYQKSSKLLKSLKLNG